MAELGPLHERVSTEQFAAITHSHDLSKSFVRIDLAAGPRLLPDWARDAHIDWAEGYVNPPRLKVRCRRDPLAFSDFGNPAWERTGVTGWIAEQDGVAAVHYHGGKVAPAEFTRKIGGEWDMTKPQLLDGEPWIDKLGLWPDQIANAKPKMGGTEHETYTMLATTQQDGYAGRHFDITMKDGTDIRLRGPWHAGAPAGFMEVSYDIDDSIERYRGRGRHQRKWHQQGGFFGLYIKPELVLDIFATFLPHVHWAWIDTEHKDEVSRRLEPLRPETDMPKGWFVAPERCPGHRFSQTSYSGPQPYDQCGFCKSRRDPAWVNPYERKVAHG